MAQTLNHNLVNNFQDYSRYYDLLYRDKDYVAEAEYVARTIRTTLPDARKILELGSGTGRHGRLLAGMGFAVHGVERSTEMVAIAHGANREPFAQGTGSFTCALGDICSLKLGRKYDAVISLFHVISYQTTNTALRAVFQVANDHLVPGGIFIFDVWHGPAVLRELPSVRVKEAADEYHRVRRIAYPELDTNRGTVKVVYKMDCEELSSASIKTFNEEHLMRYLFPTEIELLAEPSGFQMLQSEEFLSGQPPSPTTWGVTYLLQRSA